MELKCKNKHAGGKKGGFLVQKGTGKTVATIRRVMGGGPKPQSINFTEKGKVGPELRGREVSMMKEVARNGGKKGHKPT